MSVQVRSKPPTSFVMSEEHDMLLRMRDTLYEGSWDDFELDLRARLQGRPHVFETVPMSEHMTSTIRHHLALIAAMREWESTHGESLRAGAGAETWNE